MLYYEILSPTRRSINRPSLEPGLYAEDFNLPEGESPFGILAYSANRIWREQDDTVSYVKRKHKAGEPISWEVDMDEFIWIKLKAKVL